MEEGTPLALSGKWHVRCARIIFPYYQYLTTPKSPWFTQNADQLHDDMLPSISESRKTARRLFARSLTIAATSRQIAEHYEVEEK